MRVSFLLKNSLLWVRYKHTKELSRTIFSCGIQSKASYNICNPKVRYGKICKSN